MFAVIFKLNRAAALLGSLLTNMWLSVVTFVAAGKIGCVILREDWESIFTQAHDVIFHFSWGALYQVATFKILMPLMLGYLIIGAICGVISYWLILLVLRK